MQVVNSTEFDQIIREEANVLVDFFATWCGPCKMLGPVLEELDQKWNGNPRIIKVDVDESEDLARKFGVMSIPTIIIFENGEEREKHIGLWQHEDALETIKSFIN